MSTIIFNRVTINRKTIKNNENKLWRVFTILKKTTTKKMITPKNTLKIFPKYYGKR